MEIEASSLRIVRRTSLSTGVRSGEFSIAEKFAVFSVSGVSQSGGCEAESVIRWNTLNLTGTPWTQLECSEFVALTDNLLLTKKRLAHNEVFSIVDERGSTVSSFATGSGWFVNTPSFYLRKFSAPTCNRIAESLFTKESGDGLFRHSSGESPTSIGVFDLSTKQMVLDIHINDQPPIFSFSLSPSGHFLGIMSGAVVNIYAVP